MEKISKYHREIVPGVYVDVYDVLRLYGVVDQAIGHAIKKLLMPGNRGYKDWFEDILDAIKSLKRAIEIQAREQGLDPTDILKAVDSMGQLKNLETYVEALRVRCEEIVTASPEHFNVREDAYNPTFRVIYAVPKLLGMIQNLTKGNMELSNRVEEYKAKAEKFDAIREEYLNPGGVTSLLNGRIHRILTSTEANNNGTQLET